jgi:hypothetical protein
MRVRALPLCVTLAALCAGRLSHAQAIAPAPSAPSAPDSPSITPLPLTVTLGDSKLGAEAIRRAIELELKRPVALSKSSTLPESAPSGASGLFVVVRADHTVTVSFHAESGVTRTRSIGLPQDPARGAEVIALLSGNLSRDEAAELLASLAAKADANAAAENASTAAPAAAEPSKPTPSPVAPAPKTAASAPKKSKPDLNGDLLTAPYPAFDVTLAPPLSLIPNSERHLINLELGLAYSHVGALNGMGFNVLLLRTERDVTGFSYATLYNRTGGTTYGVSGAALLNRGGDVQGATFAGLASFQRDLQGYALSGMVNRSRNVVGGQLAGVVNSADELSGLQLSGIVNVADRIRGAQVGLINVAGHVEGLQLGLVNVAKHVDGAALGLVSIAGNGRAQALLWASTFMPLNAAAKFTVGAFYTQLGGGYQPSNHTYTYELGLGAHVPLGAFFIEPGVHYSEQRDAEGAFSHELDENVHYRVAMGFDLHALSPFVGAAVMQRFEHASDAPSDSRPVRVEGFAGLALF